MKQVAVCATAARARMRRVLQVVGGGAVAAGTVLAAQGDEGRRRALFGLAQLDDKLRPALATLLPAEIFIGLYSASRSPFINALSVSVGSPAEERSISTPVSAMGLAFRNDLGNAAGLDKDGSLLEFNYSLGAGFAVVGTVLSESHTGNLFSLLGGLWTGNVWTPLPHSGGALNSLGLPSKGVDTALRNIAAFREAHGLAPQVAGARAGSGGGGAAAVDFPIGVSIMGHPAQSGEKKAAGVVECVRASLAVADFIEINESCPNVHHGGGGGGGDATAELRARLRDVVAVRDEAAKGGGRRVPILVKLGDLGDARATVKFLAGLGIDGVVALNTQKDYALFDLPPVDRAVLEHYTERYGGGLSGPPILARSTEQVAAARAAVRELRLEGRFTVVHVGGVQTVADVQSSRATGAELRQWYTGLMHGLAQRDPLSLYARVAGGAR